MPPPEEILLVRQRSEFFNDNDQLGVNWNNDSLLKTAPRPPTPDPADAWKAWKNDMRPDDTPLADDDQKYFQEGHQASTMKGKMKRPKNVPDMAVGWSKQYGDGSAPKFAQSTVREEEENPEDEKKVRVPKKRKENVENTMPDGAKGPKFSKKSINNEMNRRNAGRFGNMTDW